MARITILGVHTAVVIMTILIGTIAMAPSIQYTQASVISSTSRIVVGGTIAVSGSNVYIIWWERSGNTAEPFLRISYDNGNTFGEKVMLSNATAVSSTPS